jgi:hypothetical protein
MGQLDAEAVNEAKDAKALKKEKEVHPRQDKR